MNEMAGEKSSGLLDSSWREIFNRGAFHFFLIALLGLVVYSNTFHVPFIFDDQSSIIKNHVIKDLRGFLAGAGYDYNPRRFIGYLTFALNYRFGALDVVGYHIFNLAVHLSTALLVYALMRLTFRTPYFSASAKASADKPLDFHPSSFILHPSSFIPLFTALLFVAHPVQTQAVTYIVQRLASLATLFYLLSLVLYVRARLSREEEGAGWKAWTLYLLSLASAALAMKTKEIAFTLPLVALMYEFFFFQGKPGKRIIFLLPMLLTLAIIPLSMMSGGKPTADLLSDLSENVRADTHLPRSDYLFTQFRVIVTYVRLLFLPLNQVLIYDYPIYTNFFSAPVFLSFLFLSSLIALALYLYFSPRLTPVVSRLAPFGIFWFFITLSVESSLIPIADVIFEHRLYLPSVGAFMALAAVFVPLGGRPVSKVVVAIFCVVVMALSVASYMRNVVWGDAVSLWQDNIRKAPGDPRAYDNLGHVLLDKGEAGKAIGYLRTALRLNPNFANAHYNLGLALSELGMKEEAIEHYKSALRLKPDDAEAFNNLGIAFMEGKRYGEAVVSFEAALRLKPDFAAVHNNLGIVYANTGAPDKAIRHFEAALRIDPDDARTRKNLERALSGSSKY